MRGVQVAVQKADRHTPDARLPQPPRTRLDLLLGQRQQHLAASIEPLGNRQTQPPRHQWLRQIDPKIVLLVAVLIAHLEGVAKAFGRHQRRR